MLVTKLSYLKVLLIKQLCTTAIYGISVTNDNYPEEIKILHDKFGRKESIIESLYSRLQHLPVAIN